MDTNLAGILTRLKIVQQLIKACVEKLKKILLIHTSIAMFP